MQPATAHGNQVALMVGRDFYETASPEDLLLCYDMAERGANGFAKGQSIRPFVNSIISLRAMYGLKPIPGGTKK